ncbi:hypothetical protein SELSPUOL_02417 [Selenomonas sputigena ATCC 35185]|uniref:Uncharacterized protein n=1 Tax=Selenomonas sputigena (strain ATCC 35185 / DSM 20758 / CCUG 44933 / VPI D19B-28) TaxID=546271 RepID=C9LY58_SELS3|nr:hypothetical protein SELSPUOL_02417 [Selenomonas sputigena ATCC 35185]
MSAYENGYIENHTHNVHKLDFCTCRLHIVIFLQSSKLTRKSTSSVI